MQERQVRVVQVVEVLDRDGQGYGELCHVEESSGHEVALGTFHSLDHVDESEHQGHQCDELHQVVLDVVFASEVGFVVVPLIIVTDGVDDVLAARLRNTSK